LNEFTSAEADPARAKSVLPWWTWVLPFFIANLGTWLSIWFKTDPGASLWYLPTAFGIVMAYWWGPRVLLGIYLNAVVCAPLWGLPQQSSLLYALPETLEVGLSWLLFLRFARGKYWLPNLKHVGAFLLFGSLIPTFLANTYLVEQLYLLQDIPQTAIWTNWQVLFSADLATQFVFAVPVLVLFTRSMMQKGWTMVKEDIDRPPIFPNDRNSWLDKTFIGVALILTLILISLFPVHDMRIVYGFLMIFIAIRYGVKLAILSSSWIGLLAFLLPLVLEGNLGVSTATHGDFLATNFDILFLCGVTLVTGRAISDLFMEITEHKQVEEELQKAESKYRSLAEQIPPIIYMASPHQHIGVTYISPRIEALGYRQEEWLADPQLWLRQVHPEDQTRILAEIEHNRESGKPFSSEYRLISRDGKIRWFLDEAINIEDNTGRVLFRQGFMLDITERKEAEESLSAREQYLKLLNEMTRAVLLSKDFDSTLYTLAVDMAKLIQADDCYIARWDEERQMVIPIAATISIEGSRPSYRDSHPEDLRMALAVLDVCHALAADDVYNSPYVNAELARKLQASSALGIPLIAAEHKLGAVIIVFNDPHHFTPDEIERAEQAGSQVALALWNFQQSVEIQQRLRESNTLATIERALSESERVGTGEVLQLIVDSARELMPNAEKSVIHLLEAEEKVLFAGAVSGFDKQEKHIKSVKMHLGEGVAGNVIRKGVTVNVSDIQSHPDFLLKDSPAEFRSLLVAPVQSSGQQIGTISVQSGVTNAFSTKDAELLNALAVQAAIAIENTRLFEMTQQSLKEVNILYQISRGLAASLDADQLIRDTIALLQQIFGYYHVQIYLIDPENGNLVVKHGSGYIGDELVQRGHHLPPGQGIVGHVAETGKPFFTNNVEEVVFFKRNPLLPQTQSEIAIPIVIDEKVTGVLDIQQTPPQRFTGNDLKLMTAIADQLAVVLQKANLYRTLQTALQQEQMVRSQLVQSERLALVGRLLASVSHELNNPLQAIQNALFLLREEKNLSAQAGQDLDIILSEAERMAALIERLRSAYRPVRMKDFQPVEFNTLIEDVHALISTHMRQKMIIFEFFPDPHLPDVSGLPDQLRQVVLNLFLNAIEVMQAGGRLTVSTRCLPEQKEVLLTVKDTGAGIDAEILPHVFDAFITSKHTGTGLGLTITHDIIQQHHGRITAANDPKGGAVFETWLPVHDRGGK
jgi:PAS domain S-box-containing protein